MIRVHLMIFFNVYPIKNPTSAEPSNGTIKLDILLATAAVVVGVKVEVDFGNTKSI